MKRSRLGRSVRRAKGTENRTGRGKELNFAFLKPARVEREFIIVDKRKKKSGLLSRLFNLKR